MKSLLIFITAILFLLIVGPSFSAAEEVEELKPSGLLDTDFQNAPTYIRSEQMVLFSEQRKVEYNTRVEVIHEDMTLTCDRLEATYTIDNRIDQIVAYDNVFISRPGGTQARSEKAIYDQATEILTLTVNPEVQENGSIVTADSIKIYLKEDRSEAEGEVRVKLVQQGESKPSVSTPKKGKKQSSLGGIG